MADDKLRILVFETDIPHPITVKEHGTFGQIVHKLFQAAAKAQDPPIQVQTDSVLVIEDPANDRHGKVPAADSIPPDVQVIFITEGIGDAHSNEPWVLSLVKLVRQLWETRPDIRFSGVCLGHQILARALGARVQTAPDRRKELGLIKVQSNDLGHRLLRTSKPDIGLQQMHQDQVVEPLPPAMFSWGWTAHTRVQGLYVAGRLFTCQGHLFFDEGMIMREIAARRENGVITERDEADVRRAEESAALKHDGDIVAAAMMRFFCGEICEV